MLDKNVAIGVRAAVADHLGRAPTRAELTAARRAAHSLAALGRARVLHVSGADADANAGDRSYLVLAKPNVIMNDTRLRGLAVAGSDAAGRKGPPQPRPGRSQPGTFAPERSRWCPTQAEGLDSELAADVAASLRMPWSSFAGLSADSIDGLDAPCMPCRAARARPHILIAGHPPRPLGANNWRPR